VTPTVSDESTEPAAVTAIFELIGFVATLTAIDLIAPYNTNFPPSFVAIAAPVEATPPIPHVTTEIAPEIATSFASFV